MRHLKTLSGNGWITTEDRRAGVDYVIDVFINNGGVKSGRGTLTNCTALVQLAMEHQSFLLHFSESQSVEVLIENLDIATLTARIATSGAIPGV